MTRAGIQLLFALTVLLRVVCSVMTLGDILPNDHAVKAREIKEKTRLTCFAVKASALDRKKVTKTVTKRQAKLVQEGEAREQWEGRRS